MRLVEIFPTDLNILEEVHASVFVEKWLEDLLTGLFVVTSNLLGFFCHTIFDNDFDGFLIFLVFLLLDFFHFFHPLNISSKLTNLMLIMCKSFLFSGYRIQFHDCDEYLINIITKNRIKNLLFLH